MASIFLIPPEIWAEIFHLLCKAPIYVHELNNSLHQNNFPWSIGFVCREWRNIFLSHPPLWASLSSMDIYRSRLSTKTRVFSPSYINEVNRRLALYLERTKEYPLKIRVGFSEDKSFTAATMALFLDCSHRWRTVNFIIPSTWQVGILAACKGKLPTLESLHIHDCTIIQSHHLDMFKEAPQLTRVDIKPWGMRYHMWIFPWTQLTHLRVTSDNDGLIDNVAGLLPSLHHIEDLRVYMLQKVVVFDPFPPYTPTRLNYLRVLEVPHPSFLSWLETPALSDIFFMDYEGWPEHRPFDVQRETILLIRRSGCKIRKLSFDSHRILQIGTLCDVEEIRLHDYNTSTLKSLLESAVSTSLPKLRLITVFCSQGLHIMSFVTSLMRIIDSFSLGESRDASGSDDSSTNCDINQLERITIKWVCSTGLLTVPSLLWDFVESQSPLIQIE